MTDDKFLYPPAFKCRDLSFGICDLSFRRAVSAAVRPGHVELLFLLAV
jgi:hypothetical protein